MVLQGVKTDFWGEVEVEFKVLNGCVFSAYLVWYFLVLFPCASLTHMCVPCGGSLVGLVDMNHSFCISVFCVEVS